MAQCPNCGSAVAEEASFCNKCGTALAEQQGKQPGQGRNQPAQQAQGQPQQPQNQPPRGSPAPGNTDTSRRKFLKYGGGAAVVGVGGFLVWDNFLNDRGPKETVQEYYAALDSGDADRANELIHSDSPTGEITESDLSQTEQLDITVESTNVIDESDDQATVEAEISTSFGTSTEEIELRKEDGEWKIYQIT